MEIIYAVDLSNGISRNGIIPWKLKKDMLFFMNKTKNNIVIMGKNTYFSIPQENRPLKNRFNIVLTSNPQLFHTHNNSNVLFTSDSNIYQKILDNKKQYYEKYNYLHEDFKIFIIGGKNIYEQFIPLCNTIWITHIYFNYECDLFMDNKYLIDFQEHIYEENEQLKIIEYIRIKN
jgi:dihydrofolate reductase